MPVKFAGVGEKLTDLEPFYPDRIASRILGMGDVLSLIEKAEGTMSKKEAEAQARKVMEARFTLEDFLTQIQSVKKMGGIGDLMKMMPGIPGIGKMSNIDVQDHDVARIEAIIRSMTPQERHDPRIISGSRRVRIAKGSGSQVREVNDLIKQFDAARKMMKQMAKGGGMPGMPGMGGMPGLPNIGQSAGKRAGARQKPQQKKKGKRVSGNPAKRAAEEKAAAARESAGAGGAGAFGLDQDADQEFELPKELRDLM